MSATEPPVILGDVYYCKVCGYVVATELVRLMRSQWYARRCPRCDGPMKHRPGRGPRPRVEDARP